MSVNSERPENVEAAEAMIALVGGVTGMVEQGVHLTDLARILEADPSDDLSWLRFLASRMTHSSSHPPVPSKSIEPLIFPDEARDWLLRTGRIIDSDEKRLILREDGRDHVGEAALLLATREEPGYMSEAYSTATDRRTPLSPDTIREIANHMVDGYSGSTPPA